MQSSHGAYAKSMVRLDLGPIQFWCGTFDLFGIQWGKRTQYVVCDNCLTTASFCDITCVFWAINHNVLLDTSRDSWLVIQRFSGGVSPKILAHFTNISLMAFILTQSVLSNAVYSSARSLIKILRAKTVYYLSLCQNSLSKYIKRVTDMAWQRILAFLCQRWSPSATFFGVVARDFWLFYSCACSYFAFIIGV